jgi:hypothetical protein
VAGKELDRTTLGQLLNDVRELGSNEPEAGLLMLHFFTLPSLKGSRYPSSMFGTSAKWRVAATDASDVCVVAAAAKLFFCSLQLRCFSGRHASGVCRCRP